MPKNEIEIELDIKLNGRNLQMDFVKIKKLENEVKEIILKRIKMLVIEPALCIKFVARDESERSVDEELDESEQSENEGSGELYDHEFLE